MKAILEFNLPEEKEEWKVYINASEYVYALDKVFNKVRSYYKYGHEFSDADAAINHIYEILCEAMPNE